MPAPADRLQALRQQMATHHIDAYLVPSQDAHQSEYVAEYYQARAWLSGFTGSAGMVLVTPTEAHVWTDSRYFLQAETELADSGFTLKKLQSSEVVGYIQWLADHLEAGSRLGFDDRLFTFQQKRSLEKRLQSKDIELVGLDLIQPIWPDRSPLPGNELFVHPVAIAGLSRQEKISQVQEDLQTRNAQWLLLSTLDDIAWLLNLRGSDVPYNPVFYGYVLLGTSSCTLFVHPDKVPAAVADVLRSEGVTLQPYDAVAEQLSRLPENDRIWLPQMDTSVALARSADHLRWVRSTNPVRLRKAIKNEREIEQLRQTMIKDGVALVQFYRWLESELERRPVTEAEAGEQIARCRAGQADYVGESFAAIVGFRGNGAIVHYRAQPWQSADIKPDGVLLIDSGGQYLDGTTDITRTTVVGSCTEEQRNHYTRVLQGHIALASARFPLGTTGAQLDTLARLPLWQECLNYGHGTGHGIGFFLNVHEPPQGFAPSMTSSRGRTAIRPGMVTSNEPGYYATDSHGIRIENLILCNSVSDTNEEQVYCEFETLTLFPIDLNLLNRNLLTLDEREWLNSYHRKVLERLSPHLDDAEADWLLQRCTAI